MNTGKKISALAKAFFVISCLVWVVGAVIGGIVLIQTFDELVPVIILGMFLVAAIGIFISWVSTILLKGYGDLIDTNFTIVNQQKKLLEFTQSNNNNLYKIGEKILGYGNGISSDSYNAKSSDNNTATD